MMKDISAEDMLFTDANIVQKRAEMDAFIGMLYEMNKELYTKEDGMCTLEDITVNSEPGVDIKVEIIRPKTLPKDGNAGYIYAHGGGAVMFDHKSVTKQLIHTALNLNCVVFNVDYRLGPEAKAPKGQNDFA